MNRFWPQIVVTALGAALLALVWSGSDDCSRMPDMLKRWCAVPALLMALTGLAQAADCPDLLQGSLPKLRAKESIDLCQRYADKPLV
ncbi:hypothetical protein M5G16_28850, partial [Pseudomonas sp. TNT2022 ID387]|nr:hypothetical protein [Pseudomonas aphyarum]